MRFLRPTLSASHFRLASRLTMPGIVLLGACGIAAQIQTRNRAFAQYSHAPNDNSNPILKLPAPPSQPAAQIPQKMKTPVAPASKVGAIPQKMKAPVATQGWKPRFGGQKVIRVGLSTAGSEIRIYFPDGATLFDFSGKAAEKIRAGDTAIVELDAIGGPAKGKIGPVTVRTSDDEMVGFDHVYFAVNGAPARVSTNGNNPRYARPYRGDLEVFSQQMSEPFKRRGPLALVNVVPLESYLKGVVPWEMDPDAPLEALKAQAICARTKTLDFVQSKRFSPGGFDVCDYDACQGYPGTENEKPSTTAAVEATKGLAIYQNGRPIDAVYSTNSGGITANARDVWKGTTPISYLQSVPDFAANSPLGKLWQSGMNEAKWAQFCAQNFDSFAKPTGVSLGKYEARKYRWNQQISVEEATRAFAADGISRVLKLEIVERAPSGRIKRLRVTGVDAARLKAMPTPLPKSESSISGADILFPLKSVELEGDGKIRAMFSKRLGSTTALPSSLFTISPLTDASGQISGWNLQGAGWGHGVGLCQRGAQNHARQGWSARQILNFYYRGVEIR